MRKFRLGLVGRHHHQEEATGAANGPETAASLLAAGLDVRATELASATPLQRAAAEGHVDIVHQLLKHGADVNHQDAVHGNSALHEAAWRGYSQTASLLCRQKANVDAANRAGFTPLHLACQNGHNETCRVLLLSSASADAKNHYGDTPLHTSARYGHAGVMRILISADCKVSEQNRNGDTALHIAAAMCRRKLTRILLSAGCSTALRNKQGETALDIAKRKEFREVVALLQNPFGHERSRGDGSRSQERDRSKSKSRSKREKTDSAGSSKDSGRKHKDRKRRKEQHSSHQKASNGKSQQSPYGCHTSPELASVLHPKLNSLPDEPLRNGEQYYLDLAGNIRKGPVGVQTCYCGPVLHRLECRLARDKQDILHRLDAAHSRLDAKIDGLERKTQLQLQGLQRTVDCLGLESSAAGLQRVRNSIVLANDTGHLTPPLPPLMLDSMPSSTSLSQSNPRLASGDAIARNNVNGHRQEAPSVDSGSDHLQTEVQYTLDKLGLDVSNGNGDTKGSGLKALRNRLALTRIREQQELDAIVEHYERRSSTNSTKTDSQNALRPANEDGHNSQSEESEDEEENGTSVLPPPILLSSEKADPAMLSDSRYENYDYPSPISKPLASYPALPNGHAVTGVNGVPNGTSAAVGPPGISYRNLPLPRYHLDPVLENGLATDSDKASKLIGDIDSSMYNRQVYPSAVSGQELFRYHVLDNDRDRHNDSGYSTRPGESSQGPSPSLSGPAESLEGDPLMAVTLSPRLGRKSDHFQSHFARDLAQTLPVGHHHQPGAATVRSTSPYLPRDLYPRVRFTVPLVDESDFPPGTISSSSLV